MAGNETGTGSAAGTGKGVDRDSVTAAVIASFAKSGDARFRFLVERLVTHLHAFARETGLTHAEWEAGIDYLFRAGRISDGARNEFILTSDLLGLSSLVDLLHSKPGATQGSVLGPFHSSDSDSLPVGGDAAQANTGDRVVVRGVITDSTGKLLPGAAIDFWQAAATGLYWQQDPMQDPQNLRFRMQAGADGRYAFSTVRPGPYTVPYDGPAGDLLRAGGRHAWRPAHFHFIVQAEGHESLVTEVFPEDDPWIGEDAVFGVRETLAVPFRRNESTQEARALGVTAPFYTVDFDFRLRPAG